MQETRYKKWKICFVCGERFFAKGDYKKLSQKFCSRKCFGRDKMGKKNNYFSWNKNRKMTDYPQCGFQKGHNYSKKTGKFINCEICNKRFYIPKYKIKTSRFCSNKCKAEGLGIQSRGKKRLSTTGEKHWNWKKGITPERTKIYFSKEYTEWVKAVYKRDNYTCQKCGDSSGNNLKPHHKDSFADYPELRFVLGNGITLCRNCHIYFHSKYGTHHNTKDQLKEFLNEKQETIITTRGRQVMVSQVS